VTRKAGRDPGARFATRPKRGPHPLKKPPQIGRAEKRKPGDGWGGGASKDSKAPATKCGRGGSVLQTKGCIQLLFNLSAKFATLQA
jgi:hypothetical protein